MQLSLILFPVDVTDVPFLEQLDNKAVHVIPGKNPAQMTCQGRTPID
jgi:hypothetical protein